MRKLTLGAALALVALSASAVFATSAYAFPTKTTPCSGCHSGPNIAVAATLASTSGSTATYNVSAPGADALAVFDGNAKLATITGASGQFSVAVGKSYDVFAVAGPATGDGIGSVSVSPVVAAPADTTAPNTVSDVKANYVSLAAITLTATDAGSGVAHTYYVLDGGAQMEGTTLAVGALGSHTIEFWSVDVAGNVEVHKSAAFAVNAPQPPADVTAPVTTSDAKASYTGTATIALTATDAGSGVAHTYYVLDGGIQVEGTSLTVSAVGAHTVQFFSVDVAGNAETPKTATFTVAAMQPPVTPPTTPSGDEHGTHGREGRRHNADRGERFGRFATHDLVASFLRGLDD